MKVTRVWTRVSETGTTKTISTVSRTGTGWRSGLEVLNS